MSGNIDEKYRPTEAEAHKEKVVANGDKEHRRTNELLSDVRAREDFLNIAKQEAERRQPNNVGGKEILCAALARLFEPTGAQSPPASSSSRSSWSDDDRRVFNWYRRECDCTGQSPVGAGNLQQRMQRRRVPESYRAHVNSILGGSLFEHQAALSNEPSRAAYLHKQAQKTLQSKMTNQQPPRPEAARSTPGAQMHTSVPFYSTGLTPPIQQTKSLQERATSQERHDESSVNWPTISSSNADDYRKISPFYQLFRTGENGYTLKREMDAFVAAEQTQSAAPRLCSTDYNERLVRMAQSKNL